MEEENLIVDDLSKNTYLDISPLALLDGKRKKIQEGSNRNISAIILLLQLALVPS